jgi:hypothetical protein
MAVDPRNNSAGLTSKSESLMLGVAETFKPDNRKEIT